MHANTRKKPRVLAKMDVVIPRLRSNFPRLEELKLEQAKRYKGYYGELQVDYYTNLLANQFTILRDICLEINGSIFQLDTMIITPHTIFIIDSKNYKGTITFDTALDQFTRDDGKVESGHLYPINQLEIQKFKLQQWLRKKGVSNIPIHYYTAISEPSTMIHVNGDKEAVGKVVTHASGLLRKIVTRNEQMTNAGAPEFNHEKIGKIIRAANREYNRNIMEIYGITMRDLQPGVSCPKCGRLAMERIYGNWKCNTCSHHSRYAHKPAIQDYLLVFNPWITNKICRYWLKINGRATVTRILKDTNLVYNKKQKRWNAPREY